MTCIPQVRCGRFRRARARGTGNGRRARQDRVPPKGEIDGRRAHQDRIHQVNGRRARQDRTANGRCAHQDRTPSQDGGRRARQDRTAGVKLHGRRARQNRRRDEVNGRRARQNRTSLGPWPPCRLAAWPRGRRLAAAWLPLACLAAWPLASWPLGRLAAWPPQGTTCWTAKMLIITARQRQQKAWAGGTAKAEIQRQRPQPKEISGTNRNPKTPEANEHNPRGSKTSRRQRQQWSLNNWQPRAKLWHCPQCGPPAAPAACRQWSP